MGLFLPDRELERSPNPEFDDALRVRDFAAWVVGVCERLTAEHQLQQTGAACSLLETHRSPSRPGC